MVRAGIVALLAAAVVAGGASGAPSPFSPKAMAGTWNGTWKNTRFGSTGPAKIVAKSLAGGKKLVFTADFGGNVFGCADPPAERAKPLTKGSGPGHWNEKGFAIKGPSKAFGSVALTYKAASGALAGSGTNPTCAIGLSWKVSGKFAGKKFTGKVNIKLADGTTAVSLLALTRA
jgi:hypothetical protein